MFGNITGELANVGASALQSGGAISGDAGGIIGNLLAQLLMVAVQGSESGEEVADKTSSLLENQNVNLTDPEMVQFLGNLETMGS